jgi:ribose transport system permease protein
MKSTTTAAAPEVAKPHPLGERFAVLFFRIGVLPILMIAALAVFTGLSDQFLTVQNLTNLLRQSVYLILVALGQMLALVTGGFDLSVGTIIALTSVVAAMAMTAIGADLPDAAWIAIAGGCIAGLLAAAGVGLVNGIGIAYFGVSPFIMTLGVQSVGFGLALYLTGGVPVSGLPPEFSDVLGFGTVLGIPTPVLICLIAIFAALLLLERTALGRHFYAVGGNAKAAALSGIETRRVLLAAYIICALLAAVSGLLLTARTESGEANLGGTVALESIAACVIAGVSLRGGMGRVGSVVLGAIFIGLIQNGMNLASIGSYLQMVVLGTLLVCAVIADQLRHRFQR